MLASASFDDHAKRPNVQVGDPFQEKLLIEACLELVEACCAAQASGRGRDQLRGRRGRTAAGMGMEVDLDAVPLREPSMEAWEAGLGVPGAHAGPGRPGAAPDVLEVCRRWGILATSWAR